MSLELIYSENAKLLVELQSINQKLEKIANTPSLIEVLGKIVTELVGIREEIKHCCEKCDEHDDDNGNCDDETLKFIREVLDQSTEIGNVFLKAGMNSPEAIAGAKGMKASDQAKYILAALSPITKGSKIDLPSRGKLKDAVKCAREQLRAQQGAKQAG